MLEPTELARQGYIKFDTDTGLAANGKTLCLISGEEKKIIETLRSTYVDGYPEMFNVEIKISLLGNPIVFNFRRE